MLGLHHVHGDWLVTSDGLEEQVEGDFWTLRVLANQLGRSIDDIYARRAEGLFPTLRIKATGQYLVLPAVGAAIVRHYLKHHMWVTVRIEGGRIALYSESYGSRHIGRRVLAETGRLHTPPVSARLAITQPLDAPE